MVLANIFEWIGARDERRALVQVGEHVEKVGEVVRLLNEGLQACANGNKEEADAIHEQLSQSERAADRIRRDLLTSLSEGLLLPPDREDLVRLIEGIDDVADDANGASRLVILFDGDMPGELTGELIEFAQLLVDATDRMGEALSTLYRGTAAETLRKCTEVEEIEEECDQRKAAFLRRIFSMDLTPARLLMLHDLIEAMESTSDRAEDTADVIRTLAVKVRH